MFSIMDETEIKIHKIKTLRMVHIYELTGADIKNLQQGNTAIMVYVNDGELLHLNSMDVHFEALVQKVIEVYRETTDQEAILADDTTRHLLATGICSFSEEELEHFCKMQPAEAELPFEAVLHKRFLPMAEYYIKSLHHLLGTEITIVGREGGWRGKALVKGLIGTKGVNYFVQVYSNKDGVFTLRILHFPEERNELRLEIHLFRDHMEVDFSTVDGRLYGNSSFLFQNDGMRQKQNVFYEGKEILLAEDTKKTEDDISPYMGMLFYKGPVGAVYKFPWNAAYILLDQSEEKENLLIHKSGGMYVYPEARFTELRSYTEIENQKTHICLRVDGIRMYQYKLSDGRMQTYFFPEGEISSGRYKELLAGKYFVE